MSLKRLAAIFTLAAAAAATTGCVVVPEHYCHYNRWGVWVCR
jgi:hypothetical protein